MKAAIIFTILVFLSGLIFGYGLRIAFTKDAVRAAYSMGQQSIMLASICDNPKNCVMD